MKHSTAPVTIALPGVRCVVCTFLSQPDAPGMPPSRAKAKIMRDSEVMPARAQRKFATTMPMEMMYFRNCGMVLDSRV